MAEDVAILRINLELHKQIVETADKNHMTIKAFTEKAITKLIEEYKYNYESLMILIEQNPTLILQRDLLKREFVDAPRAIIKEVMEIIWGGNFDFSVNRLNELKKENFKNTFQKDIDKIVLILKVSSEDKRADGLKELSNAIKDLGIDNQNMRLALKTDNSVGENPELIFFISYKMVKQKKEEQDVKT